MPPRSVEPPKRLELAREPELALDSGREVGLGRVEGPLGGSSSSTMMNDEGVVLLRRFGWFAVAEVVPSRAPTPLLSTSIAVGPATVVVTADPLRVETMMPLK